MKPSKNLEGQRMCKTMEERIKYFKWWVQKYEKIVGRKTIFDYFKETKIK